MTKEEQVCTLEQAIKLRELGMPQDSLFYWIDRGGQSRLVFEKNIEFIDQLPIISAYTVAELGEMMPYQYLNPAAIITASHLNPDDAMVTVWKTGKEWRFRGGPDNVCSKQMSEAQARAGLLISLIENGIVSPSKTPEQ